MAKTRRVIYSSSSRSPTRSPKPCKSPKKEIASVEKRRTHQRASDSEERNDKSPIKNKRTKKSYKEDESRKKFSEEDKRKILHFLHDYIKSNPSMPVLGMVLWKKAERLKITCHSSQSMFGHVRRVLIPQLNDLPLDILPLEMRKDITDALVRQGLIKQLNIPITKRVTHSQLASISKKAHKYKKIVDRVLERRKQGERGISLDVSATQDPLQLNESVTSPVFNLPSQSEDEEKQAEMQMKSTFSSQRFLKKRSVDHNKIVKKKLRTSPDPLLSQIQSLPDDLPAPDPESTEFQAALFDLLASEQYANSNVDIAAFLKAAQNLVENSKNKGISFKEAFEEAHKKRRV